VRAALPLPGLLYDSGIKTYDMKARAYRPEVGRFLTQDRYESAQGNLNPKPTTSPSTVTPSPPATPPTASNGTGTMPAPDSTPKFRGPKAMRNRETHRNSQNSAQRDLQRSPEFQSRRTPTPAGNAPITDAGSGRGYPARPAAPVQPGPSARRTVRPSNPVASHPPVRERGEWRT